MDSAGGVAVVLVVDEENLLWRRLLFSLSMTSIFCSGLLRACVVRPTHQKKGRDRFLTG